MWVNERDENCVDFDKKGLKDVKELHRILASLKRLSSSVDGFRRLSLKRLKLKKLDYQSIFCCQEPRNIQITEKQSWL